MKKVLFIDRDGTLLWEPPDNYQIDSFDKLKFIPGMLTWLGRIVREMDYELVMVTNQDGLGTASYPEKSFLEIQRFVMNILEGEDIIFSKVHIDRSFADENKPTRKPGTEMLTKYLQGDYDLQNSYVIGDRITDVQLAENLGTKAILLRNYENPKGWEEKISLIAYTWEDIYNFLKLPERRVTRNRKTRETDIKVEVNLDGSGRANITTGIGFFDHMLEQIARHGNIDLKISAKGDLYIDEHHTIEDVGITLGEAFSEALGDKRGIERYGFLLPMDDCLAQVALDFGGRGRIVWDAEFKREKIGEMPTEMFLHFFKSFSDAAKCNLNIKADGQNEHHKVEAIFKAFARSLKTAVKRDAKNMSLPSTKEML
ncbi:MAG: bifunctional histidinol-phosphatase/imidazoleglycerol-phosphate dehydratase HisB [FCB group bacterium]